MNNFIKVNRKILKWEWWSDINTFRLFMYMLLMAWWKEGSYKGKPIPRGSFPSSIAELSSETKLTENEIRTAIKHLKSTGEITSKAYNKFTVFTVKNYDLYQTDNEQNNNQNTDEITDKSQTINKQITSKSQTDNEQLTGTNIDNINNIDTEKEDKNNKENKNERIEDNTPPISPSYSNGKTNKPKRGNYKQLFDRILPQYEISEYLLTAVRKWLKYKYYEHHFEYGEDSLNILLEQISENSMKYGDETVCTAISESIANGYQGIVWNKIKTEKTTGYQNKTAEMLQNGYEMIADWARKKEMEEQDNDN